MASIRKRGGRYHAQVRKSGYPPLTKTFPSLTTEADMERNLHIVLPDKTLLKELLERYEKEVLPLHKSHQVEQYRLETLKRHLGDQRVSTFSPALSNRSRPNHLQ